MPIGLPSSLSGSPVSISPSSSAAGQATFGAVSYKTGGIGLMGWAILAAVGVIGFEVWRHIK